MVLSMDLSKFVSRYLRWSSQNLKSVRQTVVCETEPLERCSKGRIFFGHAGFEAATNCLKAKHANEINVI